MKITLDINDIDYGALVEVFLPMVHDELVKQDGVGVAILAKIAKMPPAIAKKMIDMLPQETKNEIVVAKELVSDTFAQDKNDYKCHGIISA